MFRHLIVVAAVLVGHVTSAQADHHHHHHGSRCFGPHPSWGGGGYSSRSYGCSPFAASRLYSGRSCYRPGLGIGLSLGGISLRGPGYCLSLGSGCGSYYGGGICSPYSYGPSYYSSPYGYGCSSSSYIYGSPLGGWSYGTSVYPLSGVTYSTGGLNTSLGGVTYSSGGVNYAAGGYAPTPTISAPYVPANTIPGAVIAQHDRLRGLQAPPLEQAENVVPQPAIVGRPVPLQAAELPLLPGQKWDRPQAEVHPTLRQKSTLEDQRRAAHFLGLGDRQFRQVRYSTAAVNYERAIQAAPDMAEPYYRLGIALAALGKLTDAVDQVEQAVTLDPSLASTHPRLDQLLGDDNRIAKLRMKQRVVEWTEKDASDPRRVFLLAVFMHLDADARAQELFASAQTFGGPPDVIQPYLTSVVTVPVTGQSPAAIREAGPAAPVEPGPLLLGDPAQPAPAVPPTEEELLPVTPEEIAPLGDQGENPNGIPASLELPGLDLP